MSRFLLYVPPCVSTVPSSISQKPAVLKLEEGFRSVINAETSVVSDATSRRPDGHRKRAARDLTTITEKLLNSMLIQNPEARLIQYDCGKLQVMSRLLRQLRDGSHRVLIFTQMTKVLDILVRPRITTVLKLYKLV